MRTGTRDQSPMINIPVMRGGTRRGIKISQIWSSRPSHQALFEDLDCVDASQDRHWESPDG